MKFNLPAMVLDRKNRLIPYRDNRKFRWQVRKTFVAATLWHKVYSVYWY